MDPDYYPSLAFEVATESTANWILNTIDQDSTETTLKSIGTEKGTLCFNLKAHLGANSLKSLFIKVYSGNLIVNWTKAYSVANFTVTQQSGTGISDYFYVENGVLEVSKSSVKYLKFSHDPSLSISVGTFNVWNYSSSDIDPTDLVDINVQFYIDGAWGSLSADTSRGELSGTTLTDIQFFVYSTLDISAITFIEDSTVPSVVRSSSNPPDPEDDESITLSAVVTDTIEVYTVKFNAISAPDDFSDVDYSASEMTNNLWTYTFSSGDFPAGYYCFSIIANDGANENQLTTEQEFVDFTVREAAIQLDPINQEGAEPDATHYQVSFVSNRAGTWSVTEWTVVGGSDAAETNTGTVVVGWNNLAWEKLSTSSTIVYFNMTVTSGSLSVVVPGLYCVAQTTFYVEDRDKTETPATVTITGRITKQANYVVYDIDGNIKETDSIDSLDFKISFNKWVLDTEQEIFFAIKFTNGSQTCWVNWTYYAIDINAYGQGAGGDSTKPPIWATNIMYWNVLFEVGVGDAFLGVYVKIGDLTNWRKS